MPNHFHLVVETRRAKLVADLKSFLGTYAGRFNRRHKLVGHLFSGRCKARIVDGSGSGYLKAVCDDPNLNPVRARLRNPEQPLPAYPWSGWPEYLEGPRQRCPWLRVDRVSAEYHIPKDSAGGPAPTGGGPGGTARGRGRTDYKALRRGWCLGDRAFRKGLLEKMKERLAREHCGEKRERRRRCTPQGFWRRTYDGRDGGKRSWSDGPRKMRRRCAWRCGCGRTRR